MEKIQKEPIVRFSKLKSKWFSIKSKVKFFLRKSGILLKNPFFFVVKLAGYSIIYGLIINYMILGIFGIKFNIWFFPAYGILVYLIKEELPLVWHKLKGK